MKAATGLGMGKQALADASALTHDEVDTLLSGTFDEAALRKVAPVLNLATNALIDMAQQTWRPNVVEIPGLKCFNTPHPVTGYLEMTVNSYLAWHPKQKEAVVFDTGANAAALLQYIQEKKLSLKALFLTHTHPDHVAAYDAITQASKDLRTYTPEREPFAGAKAVRPGDHFELPGLSIVSRLTNGHTTGGTSYLIHGLEQPVAIVGDALFCLSQGGTKTEAAYQQALESNRNELLNRADHTILCPGHGPCTTVGEEKRRNPFYPEFKKSR